MIFEKNISNGVKVRRPILRYHGGKWLLAPWIISHFPEHRTYVEPYAGAASVLLRKERSFTEVYNDLDDEIVQLFQVARDDGERLARALELTPFSRREFQNAYRKTRCPVEASRRTIIRSFMGFGSDGVHVGKSVGFRIGDKKHFVAHDWANFPAAFRGIIDRLRGVVIEHAPAVEVIQRFDAPKTLFYVDPPYVHTTRRRVDKARGYRHEMTDKQHRELAAVLKACAGMVVLSGYPSALYDELYGDWRREERTGKFADGARERTEVLWLSPNIKSEPDLFTDDER